MVSVNFTLLSMVEFKLKVEVNYNLSMVAKYDSSVDLSNDIGHVCCSSLKCVIWRMARSM